MIPEVIPNTNRWLAIDILRGISVAGMLLNLNPGDWGSQYLWLVHAKWDGWNLIDMVAPLFLFCIGAAIPLSFSKRLEKGIPKGILLWQIVWRSILLIILGLFFNLYPSFDWSHLRIPGVLQRIGLGYGIASIFVLYLTNIDEKNKCHFNYKLIAFAVVFILVSYWALLYFIPVPGFGAPRFDPVGSWPPYIDRALLGTNHMFVWWPVDGKIVFDPDGILSSYPIIINILVGVLAAIFYLRHEPGKKIPFYIISGIAMIIISYIFIQVCPIVKNIWTSTFALLSGGIALLLLGMFSFFHQRMKFVAFFYPFLVFGKNPLLAYLICALLMPLLDWNVISNTSFRFLGHTFFSQWMGASHASFLFGIIYLTFIFVLLIFFERRKIFLKI